MEWERQNIKIRERKSLKHGRSEERVRRGARDLMEMEIYGRNLEVEVELM